MRFVNRSAGLALLFLLSSALAGAATITYERWVNLATAGWDRTLSFPMFDASLGTLQSVNVSLAGRVEGTIRFENQIESPAEVEASLSAEIRLRRPDDTVIVQVLPLASILQLVAAYDGINDYAGASGRTYSDLSDDKSESKILTSAEDLALFTGSGDLDLYARSWGRSAAYGPGDMSSQFTTLASARVIVQYVYQTPEPATMVLIGSALLGLAFWSKRKFA